MTMKVQVGGSLRYLQILGRRCFKVVKIYQGSLILVFYSHFFNLIPSPPVCLLCQLSITDGLLFMKIDVVDGSEVSGQFVEDPSSGRVPDVDEPVGRSGGNHLAVRRPAAVQQVLEKKIFLRMFENFSVLVL